MPNSDNGYTPTQKRIMDVLADGEPHSLRELFKLLDAPPGDAATSLQLSTAFVCLQNHIKNVRKHVRPKGLDIVCQIIYRRKNYRLVRPITSGE
jgi:hypothetical protein